MHEGRSSEGPGDSIGPYRLVELLGQGGMGEVWLAEQLEPVQRRVAVKLIKVGMDTAEVATRFESERQALAVMDHPHIAKVFDGGATASGRPYFVMELVDGVDITTYCDEHRLSMDARVRLFTQVCHAVQHAHQKGVIHRDLKPSNILVRDVDGSPACKVIDFGVARAVEYEDGDGTRLTRAGHAIGTPAYMSPEQVLDESAAIDTRTDIYALGVILYELLSGSLPRDPGVYRGAALLGAVVEDPPGPGKRFEALADTQETVARLRGTDPASLRRHLRGDLEWIVMKAMAAERDRRYETANGLAMDLGRFLSEEPVLARPASARYRVGKFVRRNRGLVAASTAALVALVGGLVGTAQGFLQAARERDRTAAVNEYLVQEVLSAPNPSVDGSEVRVVEVLDRASSAVAETFAGQPDLEADIRATLSRTYRGLGQYDEAETHAVIAHQIRTELYGADALLTIEALDRIGRAKLGQDRFDEAIEILTEAAAGLERDVGADDERTLETRMDLAAAYARSGRFDEAIEIERDVLDTRARLFGDPSDEAAESKVMLASTLTTVGALDEAEELYLAALEHLTDGHGEEHLSTIGAMNGLANLYFMRGDFEQSEAFGRRAWEAGKTVFGEDHPEAAISLNSIASALRQAQRFEEAEPIARQVHDVFHTKLGEDHQWTLNASHNLASTLVRLDRVDEAERLHRQTLAARRRVLGETSGDVAQSLAGLGILYANTDQPERAIEVYAEALEIYRSAYGEEHPEYATTLSNLGTAYQRAGDYERSAEALRGLLVLDQRALGPTHRWVLIDYRDLIAALARYDLPAAEAAARERLAATTDGLESDDPGHLESLSLLGMTLTEQGRFEAAEELLVQAYAGLTASLEMTDRPLRQATENLARLYERWGKPDEARRYEALLNGS